MAQTEGDNLREAAEAAAEAIPQSIAQAALGVAKAAAAAAYNAAPPLAVEFVAPAEIVPAHMPPEPAQTAPVKPALVPPADAPLLAALSGPFALNAERLVGKMAAANAALFGKASLGDMTLAEQSYVATLVRTYNEVEQAEAARFAGVE